MISEDRRGAVKALFAEGKKKKEIARLLSLAPKTVRRILGQEQLLRAARSDKKTVEPELLRQVYKSCKGYVQRVHEILSEDYGVEIGYSTLGRLIREEGIGQRINKRCYHVDDAAGEEMQHDTTPHTVKIGNEIRRVICSGLYLRYSKMRYVKFFPSFNRFRMKCFFHEALTHWGYVANSCVIDNTSLAVLHGTGKEAVFHPEMTAFAKAYGFSWVAHEAGHSNRKAGKERDFWTIETNFFPGRTFTSIEDLNHQVFEWATQRYAHRPLSKSRLIPAVLFEQEKQELIKLPPYVEPPYQSHKRDIDQYGYVAFGANYYWVPGKSRGQVCVIEYPGRMKIFPPQKAPAIEYPLPAWNLKNQKFSPEGANVNPYEPRHIVKPCHEEEKRLRQSGQVCCEYLDFIKSSQSGVKQRSGFIRQLYALSKKMAPSLFIATLERALQYHVANIRTLARISSQLMQKDLYDDTAFPDMGINNDYEQRQAYQQGRFSQEAGSEVYRRLLEENGDTLE